MARPNQQQMLRQLQQMQAQMAQAQEELAQAEVSASAGGGAVTVTASGAGEIRKVAIAPHAVDPDDLEMLEDLIVAAVNEAVRAASELQQQKLGGATQGLQSMLPPGLLGL
jgi:hypothetical protein